MAILGLVIQQPDTVAGVALRLDERFPRARFARSAAHNNLPSLARQGLVQLVQRDEEGSQDRYEATQDGTAQFREWLRDSSAAPPALRDALHAKLELSQEEDLHALIRAVGEEEQACERELADAHARHIAATRLGRLRGGPDAGWREKVRGPLMTDEVLLWGLRTRRLQRLREELEELGEEIERSDGEHHG
jgi:DNA-binding PadR family transcriptional regulator